MSKTGAQPAVDPVHVIEQTPIRVLLIEDNPGDVRLVQEVLAANGARFEVESASRLSDGLDRLDPARHDAVLLDLGLPDAQGLDSFHALRERTADVPVVILTSTGDEDVALEAVAAGAQDYLVKDQLPTPALPRALRYAIERHRLIRSLQYLTDDLRDFVAHAAHDLRTPIATVAGLAETLQGAGEALSDVELAQVLAAVRRQASRASQMITDLLDLAKVQVDVALEPVELADSVGRALRDVPPPDGTRVVQSIPDDLPPVQAEGDRLERLLTNLLSNAYRYGGSTVALRGRRAGTDVVLEVADDGPGIPEDLLARLFEPFARGSNSAAQGTGLGLSIVRQIARGFGGSADCRPDVELGGACFVVRLPAAEADRTEP